MVKDHIDWLYRRAEDYAWERPKPQDLYSYACYQLGEVARSMGFDDLDELQVAVKDKWKK